MRATAEKAALLTPDQAPLPRTALSRLLRRLGLGERGQSMLEFALALPVFLVVLMGVLEFSFILSDQIQINNAARDGARAGAIPAGIGDATRKSQASTAATTAAGSLISCPLQAFNPTTDGVAPVQSTTITVNLSCTYTPITPLGGLIAYLGKTFNGNITMHGDATKTIEP